MPPISKITTSCTNVILGWIYAPWVLVFFDRLLLRQWTFEDRHTTFLAQFTEKKKQKRNDEYNKDKNVASLPVSEPNSVPSHASIVAQKLLKLSAPLVLREINTEAKTSINQFYTAPSRVPFPTRLNEVTRKDVPVRSTPRIGKWVAAYCILQALLSTGTIVSVFYEVWRGVKAATVVWHAFRSLHPYEVFLG